MRPSAHRSCPTSHQRPTFSHRVTWCIRRSFVGFAEKSLLFLSLTRSSRFVPFELLVEHHLHQTLKLVFLCHARQFLSLVAFYSAYWDGNGVGFLQRSRGLAAESYLIPASNWLYQGCSRCCHMIVLWQYCVKFGTRLIFFVFSSQFPHFHCG